MMRPDRGTLRSAGFVLLLACVFVVTNTQVVYAATSDGTGDLLAPLNIPSSEGVPINGYELNAEGGSLFALKSQALAFAMSGLFALIRVLVGLAGWAIEMAFRFPLLKILTVPAQKVADVYNTLVVDTLGLKGLLLAWAFVFAGFMIVRGRVGRGLGEIFLTLLIAAFAASTFVRPDYLLAQDGPLGQAQQVAAEVAQKSVNSYDWGGKIASAGPCDGMAGREAAKCWETERQRPASAKEVARPLQDSITNALVVKPYMLLQYGRILDPAKASDRKAYTVHLRWITGGYKAGTPKGKKNPDQKTKDACSLLKGAAKMYCEQGGSSSGDTVELADPYEDGDSLDSLAQDGALLEVSKASVTDEDREFYTFLKDMKKAGAVGRACASYAEKPTWWRVAGAVLLLVAALFVCGMLLSSAIVLLGTQGVCAGAAACGGVTFVAGMLPGPARQSVWKWLSLWGISILTMVGVCAFVPLFGIAVDATITNGPDLMVERILLIDVLAIAGTAGHRRLLAGTASFGRRMAMRMRYAKVGGTHMPGDTSELGAALAMNSPAAFGNGGGGLRSFTGGGGRFGVLGTRHRLMGALTSMADGTGMPVNTGGLFADALAEAGRGLAPLTAATAVGGLGVRLGAKSGHWLLIGRRLDQEQLARWQKATAGGGPETGGPSGGGAGGPGGGPRRPGGPPDRYRDDEGQIVDRDTGRVLHDQDNDRTLLSTRAHNRLVRLRGYRALHLGGRAVYGATAGLPVSVRRARAGGSRYAQDARQQVRVWGNTLREDGRAWADAGRHVSRGLRESTGDRGGNGPFTSRPTPAPAPVRRPGRVQPTGTGSAAGRTGAPASEGRSLSEGSAVSSNRSAGGSAPRPDAVLPGGGGAGSSAREEARARMQELMRRTAPEAERIRRERGQRPEGGEDG
ncbi:hypothetical protein [Streptomyces sp. NPDC002559]